MTHAHERVTCRTCGAVGVCAAIGPRGTESAWASIEVRAGIPGDGERKRR